MAATYRAPRRSAVRDGWSGTPQSLYLLSAGLMMAGCYSLAHSLDLQSGAAGKLILLIAVVIACIAAAFALLSIGAIVNLRHAAFRPRRRPR